MAQLVRAPPCHGGGRGFEPHPGRWISLQWYSKVEYGVLAQLGEHLPYKQRVIGSSPIGSICRSGGTGRRPGLKIPWVVIPVPVRFRSAALVKSRRNVEFTAFLLFFLLQKVWTPLNTLWWNTKILKSKPVILPLIDIPQVMQCRSCLTMSH